MLERSSVRMGCVITKIDTVQRTMHKGSAGGLELAWSWLSTQWCHLRQPSLSVTDGVHRTGPARRLQQLVASETGVPKNMVRCCMHTGWTVLGCCGGA